jgi:hypothetical protein
VTGEAGRFAVGALPAAPLAAAARFHAEVLPRIEAALASDAPRELTLVFEPADHRHRGWRLAAVQELARAHAPLRINAVAADGRDTAGAEAIAATCGYLAAAPGVTGQLLVLDSHGAGEVVGLPA